MIGPFKHNNPYWKTHRIRTETLGSPILEPSNLDSLLNPSDFPISPHMCGGSGGARESANIGRKEKPANTKNAFVPTLQNQISILKKTTKYGTASSLYLF